ncbi:MAG: hypothetical protein KDG89_14400 [Geminicoccaceae bacterium]|nr:hypothetical protein [Geminicoccaceae bacterium]
MRLFLTLALLLAPLAAHAQSLRLEAGLGGDVAVIFGDLSDEAEAVTGVDDFAGAGVGGAGNLAVWFDTPSGFSVGVQGFADHAGLDIEIDHNDIDGDRDSYGALALFAYRRPTGPHHPYVGGGIGYAWTDASYEQFDRGDLEIDLRGDDGSVAGSFFGGYDYDLNPHAYVGVRATARFDGGTIVSRLGGSADYTQITTGFTGQVGVRF